MSDDEAEVASSTSSPVSGESKERVRPYDFSRPNKLSKEQLRVLQAMHEPFARGLGLTLSAYLRMMVEAEVVAAVLMTYEEYTRRLPSPAIVSIFALPPLDGNAILEIYPDFAFALLDRLLGGFGSRPTRLRELTDIEQPVIRRVAERTMANLAEAWQHVAPIEPQYVRTEYHPPFTQLAAAKDMLVVIRLEIKLKGMTGRVNLGIPFHVIEPIVPKLSARELFVQDKQALSRTQSEALRAKLAQMEVPVTVILGRAHVSMKELLELRAGDYIPLDTVATDPLPILVGNLQKLSGRPGRAGKRLAVEVVAIHGHEEAM